MRFQEKEGQFQITEFNEFEAYRIACKIEKDGMAFYQKLLGAIDKPEVKYSLRFLVAEEQKHLKFFEGQIDKLRQAKEEIMEEVDLISSMDFGVFHPFDAIDNLNEVVQDIPHALKLAIKVEEKSIIFYQLCKKEISSAAVGQELESIVEEEKKHKALLESIFSTH